MKSIAHILVQNQVVKTNFQNPFTWTSGIRSPIYCDCRELIGIPEARKIIVDHFVQKINSLEKFPDLIAGTATAGIPWAAFVAEKLDLPMLYVRGKPKSHGAGKMVEGRGERDKSIVVVEDAFSTAGSSIVSVNALRSELDATVKDILGIFSWDTPQAKTNAQTAQVTLHPLTDFHEIAESLREQNAIKEEEFQQLIRFHKNPDKWWES